MDGPTLPVQESTNHPAIAPYYSKGPIIFIGLLDWGDWGGKGRGPGHHTVPLPSHPSFISGRRVHRDDAMHFQNETDI